MWCLVNATDELILMKFYTVVVYKLWMCYKEHNPGLKKIKGDNSRELIICVRQGILCDFTHSSNITILIFYKSMDVVSLWCNFGISVGKKRKTVCLKLQKDSWGLEQTYHREVLWRQVDLNWRRKEDEWSENVVQGYVCKRIVSSIEYRSR